jgi:hypothetical protein
MFGHKGLKVTITYEATANGEDNQTDFDLYYSLYDNLEHYHITGDGWHTAGIDTLHEAVIYGVDNLVEHLTGTPTSCSYYLWLENHHPGTSKIYINDTGIALSRIVAVDVEAITELPTFEEDEGTIHKYKPVYTKEYEELKAKANAAAPKSTVYTKEEVDNKIASLDYIDNADGFVYKIEQTDGIIKPYKKPISRENIPDFAYTHFVELPEIGDVKGIKVIVSYGETEAAWQNGVDFDLYFKYYDVVEQYHISASGYHEEGTDPFHAAYIYGNDSLYDHLTGTPNTCEYYLWNADWEFPTSYGGTAIYINDTGITSNRITGLTAEVINSLPTDPYPDNTISKFSMVRKDDYAGVKAKAEAAAPQATTYTKDEVDNKIASLDYTDNAGGFVYKIEQTDGVIKPYKKSISRDYITDFRYTHKAVIDLETTPPNAKYLKVTVGSPEGNTTMLYKMYVFSYWLAAEVEISTDSTHRTNGGAIDKAHSATIFTENLVELVDKIEYAEGSCSFYFKVGGSIEYNGCTVYIDDESGMCDAGISQKVTSLDVTLVEELPTDAKTFDRIFTIVDKAEYNEVKEKANHSILTDDNHNIQTPSTSTAGYGYTVTGIVIEQADGSQTIIRKGQDGSSLGGTVVGYELATTDGLEIGMKGVSVRLGLAKYNFGSIKNVFSDDKIVLINGAPNNIRKLNNKNNDLATSSVYNVLTIMGRPDLGDTPVSFYATAFGVGAVANEYGAVALGNNTHALGKHSLATGRNTVAAYDSFSQGWNS